jgi:Na+/phosphate symporter
MKTTILGVASVIFGAILMIPLLVNPSPVTSSTTLQARHSVAGSFAAFIVAVALLGPPLTGQSMPTLMKLRHDILMMDREFERSSMRINPSFIRTTTLVQEDLRRAGSTRSKTQLREAIL